MKWSFMVTKEEIKDRLDLLDQSFYDHDYREAVFIRRDEDAVEDSLLERLLQYYVSSGIKSWGQARGVRYSLRILPTWISGWHRKVVSLGPVNCSWLSRSSISTVGFVALDDSKLTPSCRAWRICLSRPFRSAQIDHCARPRRIIKDWLLPSSNSWSEKVVDWRLSHTFLQQSMLPDSSFTAYRLQPLQMEVRKS